MAWGPAAPGSCPPSTWAHPCLRGLGESCPRPAGAGRDSSGWHSLCPGPAKCGLLTWPGPAAAEVEGPEVPVPNPAGVSQGAGQVPASGRSLPLQLPTLTSCFTGLRNQQGPRPGPAMAAPEASWALHTSKGLELDSTEGHLGDSPRAGGGAEGRDRSFWHNYLKHIGIYSSSVNTYKCDC